MNLVKKRRLKAAIVVSCFLALIAAARFCYLEEQGNFHPITLRKGLSVRSA